jgi:hypothetical protein
MLCRVLFAWVLLAASVGCSLWAAQAWFNERVFEPEVAWRNDAQLHIDRLAAWFERACPEDFRDRHKWVADCDQAERQQFTALAAAPLPTRDHIASSQMVVYLVALCSCVFWLLFFALVFAAREWSIHQEEVRTRKKRE